MFAWQGSCVSDAFQSIKGQDRSSHWKKGARDLRRRAKSGVRGERRGGRRKEKEEGGSSSTCWAEDAFEIQTPDEISVQQPTLSF